MPRLFIAVDLPQELKQKLGELRESLNFLPARWVKEENLHLTLKFLGQVEEKNIPLISSSLKCCLKNFPAVTLKTGKLGAFPNFKRARVLWIDLKDGREEVRRLASLIEDKLLTFGFEKENRDFEPHITLARFKRPISLNLPSIYWSFIFHVDEVILFESFLKPTGPIYLSKERFLLNKTGD